jgi:hypothetical protein
VFVCLFSAEPFVRQVRAELNRESEQRKSAASAGMLRPFLLVVRTYSTIRLPRILYPHESPLLPERLCTPRHA